MMIEQHYDEEVLAEFLAEPRDAASRDKHLASCDLCLGSLDTLRATARTLKEPAVWGPSISTAPRPETLAFLRGVAKTMADEDATAAVWIKELLAGPREEWAARLAEHPEWRTGGMVRRLLKAGDEAVAIAPLDAVTITAIAVQLAEGLAESAYPRTALRHLRGLAHYDYGYALWYTGAMREAVETLDSANSHFDGVIAAEFDRGRADLMRSMIYDVLERRDEALSIANVAAAVFARYEDNDRFAAARSASAITLQSAQRIREALAIHAEVSVASVSDRWKVSAIANMALCYRDLGDFSRAADCLVRAIEGYERLGMMTFRSKSRWALADVFARQGKYEQALSLYDELRPEFEECGMANDVAMISLDIAETLLTIGRTDEIGEVCRKAMVYFVASNLSQTEPALRALAYVQEALVAGRVTPAAIRGIRAFLLAPTEEPVRLFAEIRQ